MSRKKTMGIFAFVAIAALLTLGIGYAAWADQLTLTDNVNTGTFEAHLGGGAVTPTNVSGGQGTCVENFGGTNNNHTLTIEIDNAYPGFKCSAVFTINNGGTVPMMLGAGSTGIGVPVTVKDGANDAVTFNGDCGGWTGGTINPGASVTCTGTAMVLAGSNPGGNYSTSATLNFVVGS